MTIEMQSLRRSAHHRATPLRLTPLRGRPRCLLEQVGQHVWQRKLLWYVALVAALILAAQFGVDSHLHHLIFR